MKICSVAALMTSFIPMVLYGAEAVIMGQGQVRSAPDYVELSIMVDSKCYSTPAEARKVNDDASRKIVDFLNTKITKKDAYNSVVTTGGFTSAYQTYYQNKYFCENTFQKQNTIIFRTQEVDKFEELFEEIQSVVYKEIDRYAPSIIQTSISFAVMSSPIPGISNEQRTELEKQAIGLAFKDAKAKLTALFGNTKVLNLKLVSATESTYSHAPIPRYQRSPMASAAMAEMGGSQAPVQFDEQEISKSITFKFTFDDLQIAQ